jgi:hypothetical protein
MEALHKVGAIDKQTMRRFDDCLLDPGPTTIAETDQASPETRAVSQS